MTIVAIWKIPNGIYCASDTKISQVQKAQDDVVSDDLHQTLTLLGSKIFPMAATVWENQFENGGVYRKSVATYPFGFAFAGSTLGATSAFAICSAILSNLVCTKVSILSLEAIAKFFAKISQRFLDKDREFEMAVFGFCQATKKYRIFHITGETQFDSLEHVGGEALLLGSHKAEVAQLISARSPDTIAPIRTLNKLIKEETYKDIGGELNLATVNQFGFVPMLRIKPVVMGQPSAEFSFLGLSERELEVNDAYRMEFRAQGFSDEPPA